MENHKDLDEKNREQVFMMKGKFKSQKMKQNYNISATMEEIIVSL